MWSMVSVPLYPKLGPATISYILAEVEASVVVAMDEASVRTILDCLPMASPRIQVLLESSDLTDKQTVNHSLTMLALSLDKSSTKNVTPGDHLHQRGEAGGHAVPGGGAQRPPREVL